MSAFGDIVLGIVQGLSEFLPISSEGHLTLAQHFLGYEGYNFSYVRVLQLATLLAVVIVLRKLILQIIRECFRSIKEHKMNASVRFLFMLTVATIPVGVVGAIFNSYFENLYGNITAVGYGFIWTGLILFMTSRVKSKSINLVTDAPEVLLQEFNFVSYTKSFVVGCFQALAFFPGVSRLGMTIAGGLFCGMTAGAASAFSIILLLPTTIVSIALEQKNLIDWFKKLPNYSVGFLVTLIFGIIALKAVLIALKKNNFANFAAYVWVLAILCLFFF